MGCVEFNETSVQTSKKRFVPNPLWSIEERPRAAYCAQRERRRINGRFATTPRTLGAADDGILIAPTASGYDLQLTPGRWIRLPCCFAWNVFEPDPGGDMNTVYEEATSAVWPCRIE